jgi:hypothetical protein
MIKRLEGKGSSLQEDQQLRLILKEYDPETPLAGHLLAALEKDILSRIDLLDRTLPSERPEFFPGFFLQAWGARVAAFGAVVVLISGFVFGQVFSNAEDLSPFAGTLSLVAFADEASGQFLPVSEPSWGVNDDNAE